MSEFNLVSLVNQELKTIDEWMKINRLSLNYRKSSFFISTSKYKRNKIQNFCINVGQQLIPYSGSAKYLGVVIDHDLSWKNQIENVLIKLANASRILSQVKHFVNKSFLIKLYYSFVYPHIKYGILAWGGTANFLINKLQIAQNRIIRNINFKSIKDCIKMNNFYKSMELLKINDIYKLEMAKFMHLYFNDKLPENFKNFLTSAKNLHSHSTRSINNQNYYLERVNLQGIIV